MKILHLAAADIMLNPILREQLLFLRENGYAVHAASIEGPLARRLHEQDHFPWTPLPLSRSLAPFEDWRAIRFIEALCRREKFDLVHTHTPKGNFVGTWAARRAGVPLVMETLHGLYFHERSSRLSTAIWTRIERLTAARCDLVFFQNPEDVETSRKKRIVPLEKTILLGNGVNLRRFRPRLFSAAERAAYRRKLGVPTDAFVVGMAGRFVREKGWPTMWAAAARLAGEFPKFFLLAVGHRLGSERPKESWRPPSAGPEMRALAQRALVLEDREDMPELYACMDAAALPSLREGFPRVLLEGAASGLPQVATNIRGCRQAVEDGKTGFLTPVNDPLALVGALAKLQTDRSLCQALGEAARFKAEREFEQEDVFRKIAQAYREKMRQ
jgi:glycosyltransferase involved in cell wall biosynthesis